jgi:hypothetical protein
MKPTVPVISAKMMAAINMYLRRGAIRGNQWQSVAISGNQHVPEEGCNQWQ